ncbi:hypothetical protein BC629DRAFT_1580756 [Irpex lacteus]|nr:hypothetical protein BC629DRAFT_1580756 [Irpex lacteus]
MADPHSVRRGLILAVNAGSSSLKISLYRNVENGTSHSQITSEPVELLLVSNITNISAPPASSLHTRSALLRTRSQEGATSIDRSEIVHVCHRVVHGGDYFEPVVITTESYHHIERLSDLAPLHNGAALSVIKACIEALPNATSIAYFDTSFHRSMPPHIANYAIDQTIAKKRGLKKYGFQGSVTTSRADGFTSDAYILRAVAAYLKRVKRKSLDTSMGLTPLTGLPGANARRRSRPLPDLPLHEQSRRISHDKSQAVNVPVTLAEEILNKKSGWKAITVEGKVDAVVFSGGIGERSVELREFVMGKMACFAVDKQGGEV